jgi:hypothetical protein
VKISKQKNKNFIQSDLPKFAILLKKCHLVLKRLINEIELEIIRDLDKILGGGNLKTNFINSKQLISSKPIERLNIKCDYQYEKKIISFKGRLITILFLKSSLILL